MADSNYYVDKYGDVWTSVLRDSSGNIIAATRVDPTTGRAMTSGGVGMFVGGNPEFTVIPATGKDSYFAWKQGIGDTGGTTRITEKPKSNPTDPGSASYGVLPPTQTGLPGQLVLPEINVATPAQSPGQPPLANVNQTRFTQDATTNLPVRETTELTGYTTNVVQTGPASVSIAMPGSTVNANVNSNPGLGNVVVNPDVAAPVITPVRAQSFDPVTGGVNAGPASQVTLSTDGKLYITPDLATTAELGTGVTQDANGRYIATDGAVVVVPPNTAIQIEPGASVTAMPETLVSSDGTVNQETLAYQSPALNLQEAQEAVPINSAGEIVSEANQSYVENAATQNPSLPDEIAVDQSNNTGLTEPGTSNQRQQRDVATAEETLNLGGDVGEIVQLGDGIGIDISNKEDTAENNRFYDQQSNPGAAPVATEFVERIIPTPNTFKRFATMTYSVSVYTMSAERYSYMVSTGSKSVKGMTLILQSAGANIGNTEAATLAGNFGAVRSPEFDLDFYIDDIEMNGLISGTAINAPHNNFDMKFKIREPNGLSFLDRLHAEVKRYQMSDGAKEENVNYAAQNFLMVIRFYGYDQYGNAISGSTLKQETTSDPNAITEKFIPFRFTSIRFTLSDNLVEYICETISPQSQFSTSDVHSRIPFNIQIVGQKVKDVLAGTPSTSTDASGAPTLFTGLAGALNRHETEKVARKVQEHANKYIIEFEPNSGIGDAITTKPGSVAKTSTAMSAANENPANKLDGSKNGVKKDQRIHSIPAGTSLIQAIEFVLRNSSYITAQQMFTYDEKTGEVIKNPDAKQKVFQWYKIRTEVKPEKYDNITHQYSYTIKYVISRYQVNDVKSSFFPVSFFRGVHKEYNYWFTGENTEILDFTQDYNFLYYQQMSDAAAGSGATQPTNNTIHIDSRFYMPRSNESAVGGAGSKSAEAAANAASILYSPADNAQAQLTIVGDPDWIAQSEIFYSPKVSFDTIGLGPTLPDGSVNYDASEVLFGIKYNSPSDYDQTGLMDINYKKNQLRTNSKYGSGTVSLAYRANELTTMLSGGAFKQIIKGTLMQYYDTTRVVRTDGGYLVYGDEGTGVGSADGPIDTNVNSPTSAASISAADTGSSDITWEQEVDIFELENMDMDEPSTPSGAVATGDEDISDVEFEQELALQELAFLDDNTTPITSDQVAQATGTPMRSTQTTNQPAQRTVVEVAPEQANTDFELPPAPPPVQRSETVQNTAGAKTDNNGNYVYNGVDFSANTQVAYDDNIRAINYAQNRTGFKPRYIDDYDPFFGSKVRYRVDIDNTGNIIQTLQGVYDINGSLKEFDSSNTTNTQIKQAMDQINAKIERDRNQDPFFEDL